MEGVQTIWSSWSLTSNDQGRGRSVWLRYIGLWQPSVFLWVKEVHLQNASGPVGWRATQPPLGWNDYMAVGRGRLYLDGQECDAVLQTTRLPAWEKDAHSTRQTITRTIWVTRLSEEFVDVVLVCMAVEDLHNVSDEKRTLPCMSIRHRICRIEWKDN